MPWAMSAASSSGCLISWMLSDTRFGLAGDLLDVLLQPVRLRAATADDDARARGVDVDARAVARALDLDPADRRALELGVEVVADLPVLHDVVAVGALVEPPRLPVRGDPEPEPVGVDLLAHQSVCSSFAVAASSPGASGASSGAASASSWASASTPAASASVPSASVPSASVPSASVPSASVASASVASASVASASVSSASVSSASGAVPSTAAAAAASSAAVSSAAAAASSRRPRDGARGTAGPRGAAIPRRDASATRRRSLRGRARAVELVLVHPRHDDRDVAGALADARPHGRGRGGGTASSSRPRRRTPTRCRARLATWPSLLTAFAIAEARTLAMTEAASARRGGEDLLGAHDVLAAHEVEHLRGPWTRTCGSAGAPRGCPGARWCGSGGHQRRTDLSWPAWKRNVLVGRELAELVADHGLGHVDRDVAAAVVDRHGVPDHVGDDRAAARPGLDDLLVAGGVHRLHLLQQVVVDERSLLQASRHLAPSASRRGRGVGG